MPRRSGGTVRPGSETVRPPTRIVPRSGSMNPATSRSVVVLPQPDGPSRQTSEPCAIVRLSVERDGVAEVFRQRFEFDLRHDRYRLPFDRKKGTSIRPPPGVSRRSRRSIADRRLRIVIGGTIGGEWPSRNPVPQGSRGDAKNRRGGKCLEQDRVRWDHPTRELGSKARRQVSPDCRPSGHGRRPARG